MCLLSHLLDLEADDIGISLPPEWWKTMAILVLMAGFSLRWECIAKYSDGRIFPVASFTEMPNASKS